MKERWGVEEMWGRVDGGRGLMKREGFFLTILHELC